METVALAQIRRARANSLGRVKRSACTSVTNAAFGEADGTDVLVWCSLPMLLLAYVKEEVNIFPSASHWNLGPREKCGGAWEGLRI